MPWWGIVLIAVGAAGIGVGLGCMGIMIYIAKGIHW
jgi:hypothetical protein